MNIEVEVHGGHCVLAWILSLLHSPGASHFLSLKLISLVWKVEDNQALPGYLKAIRHRAQLRRVRNTFHIQESASEEVPQKDAPGRTGGFIASQHLV